MYDGVPDKNGVTAPNDNRPISGGDGAANAVNPNGTVYFTTTTASGLKYYELFNNANNLYVKDNIYYPYLVDGKVGSVEYMNGNLPLSNAKYLQDKTPGYLYVEVDGDTVTFSYYNLDDYADTPYDTYTVTKQETPANIVTVTGMNPGFEVGLAYNSPTWVKEPAKYGEAVVQFTVPNADDSYRIALNGRGYGDTDMLVIDNVRAGDTVDVSGYFYDVVIPDGWNSVYVNTYPYQWCVENANAGDTITLLKTMKPAAIYINGAEKKIDFILDGSNPFAPTVVNASASAAIIKTDGSINTLVIAVTEILSDGTTNTISAIFTIENNAKGTYPVGAYRVYVATSDGKVTECYIVKLVSIEVTTMPKKTEYFVGDALDLTGMVVTATYSDGSTMTVADWTSSPGQGDNLNDAQEVTVQIGYVENGVAVNCRNLKVNVKPVPVKIVKSVSTSSSTVSKNGVTTVTVTVTVKYEDGASERFEYSSNSADPKYLLKEGTTVLTYGKYTVTITWTGKGFISTIVR